MTGVGSEFGPICAACGNENPEGFRHCGFCGASLAPVAARREQRKLVTVVFCDLVGSVTLGESQDQEALGALLGRYFERMKAIVERHGGTVEKFIGDAVKAVFGVPAAHEDDALRALRAAVEMRAALPELGLEAHIGVNTGEVLAVSEEWLVTGDAVNVAARLQQAAAPGEILLGALTEALARDAITVEELAPLALKGKAEPVAAFRLLTVGALGPLPQRAGAPLVGRERELALVEQEFEAAVAERRCRLVTVIGEPGVGKTRLTAELVERIGPRARVSRGACLSYGEGITFWAVGQIVRDLAGIRDEHSADEARRRVEPRLAQLLGLAEGTATADQVAQAVAQFLAAAAAERPLVVLVDDIHWAEPGLLELLTALPAMIKDAPLLLIALARPELLETRPDWPVTLGLEPLGAAEVDVLLDGLGAPAVVRVRLAQAAAGNPLFAEELVAWVHEGGDLDDMPTTLNALLGARLDRLEARARDALERGSIEGDLFHRGAVVELSDETSRLSVPGELDELTSKDLIRPAAASFAGEIAYRFKHILFRDAAYRATAKKLRAALHEHFADWLERLVGERVSEYQEILGYHFEQAYRYRAELGDQDEALAARAAHHLGAAGRRANDRADVHAAANLLGRATVLLPADSLERLELLLPYGGAVNESARVLEALAIFGELDERATALGERGLAAHARCARAGVGLFANLNPDLDETWAIAEDGLATFTEFGDEAGLARAKRELAQLCWIQGRRAEAAAWLEQALVHANACGDQVTRRTVAETLAKTLYAGPMPVGDAIRRVEELREASSDDRVAEAVITRYLSALLAMAERFDEAREYWRRSSRVLEEVNIRTSWHTRIIAAYAKELAGDRAGAREELEARLLFYREHTLDGTPDGREAFVAYRLAEFYCDDGHWDDAEECVAPYRDVPDPNNLTAGFWDMRLAVLARLAGNRGEHTEARRLAQRAVELAERTDELNLKARIWLALAEVQRGSGRVAEADTAVAAALDLYEQKGNVAAADRLRTAAYDAAR